MIKSLKNVTIRNKNKNYKLLNFNRSPVIISKAQEKTNYIFHTRDIVPALNTFSKLNTYHIIKPSKKNNFKILPSSTKIWTSLVYNFNMSFIKNIPVVDNYVKDLIKNFFSMTYILDNIYQKKSSLLIRRFKRLSLVKIFVSKPEIKHNMDGLYIKCYIYNKKNNFVNFYLKYLSILLRKYGKRKKKHLLKLFLLNKKLLGKRLSNKRKYNILVTKHKKIINKYIFVNKPIYLNKILNLTPSPKKAKLNVILKYNGARPLKIESLSVNTRSLIGKRPKFPKIIMVSKLKKRLQFHACAKKKNLTLIKILNLKKEHLQHLEHLKLVSKKKLLNPKKKSIKRFNYDNKIFRGQGPYNFMATSKLLNKIGFLNLRYLTNIGFKQEIYFKYVLDYILKNYAKKSLYLTYVRNNIFNNIIYKNWFLNKLINVIGKLYNKRVILSIVSLKYHYLHSDIVNERIKIKLRQGVKPMPVLSREIKKINLRKIDLDLYNTNINTNNIYYKYIKNYIYKFKVLPYDIFKHNSEYSENKFSQEFKGNASISKIKNKITKLNNLEQDIIKFISYKSVFGVKLQAKGRLSTRSTASRRLLKRKYIGDQRANYFISPNKYRYLLSNNNIINIDFSKISSKTRNGSFGIKGWINNN